MSIYSVYKITNVITNKVYIGYTKKSIYKRINEHFISSRNPKTLLHKSICKYGINNFTIEEIYSTKNKSHCCEMETHFINEYQSHFLLGNGYNMTTGGDGGDTSCSENYKKSMSERRPYNGKENPNYGNIYSSSTREYLSTIKKGKTPKNYDNFIRHAVGKKYYHNPITGEEGRYQEHFQPNDWVEGRMKFQCQCGKVADKGNLSRYHKNCGSQLSQGNETQTSRSSSLNSSLQ